MVHLCNYALSLQCAVFLSLCVVTRFYMRAGLDLGSTRAYTFSLSIGILQQIYKCGVGKGVNAACRSVSRTRHAHIILLWNGGVNIDKMILEWNKRLQTKQWETSQHVRRAWAYRKHPRRGFKWLSRFVSFLPKGSITQRHMQISGFDYSIAENPSSVHMIAH